MPVAGRNADDDVLTNASRAAATGTPTAVDIVPIDVDATRGDHNSTVAWRNAYNDVLTNARRAAATRPPTAVDIVPFFMH